MHAAFDCESYRNVFTMAVMPIDFDTWWVYEVSGRRNDARKLYDDLKSGVYTRFYGFNNMSYDWPLVHYFLELMATWGDNLTPLHLADLLYRKTVELINVEWGKGWEHHVWPRNQVVPQCDLMMLNHFDNPSKVTSLKDLMFNLQCPNMAELPFPPGTVLTDDQIDTLINYNVHSDCWTTKRFAIECRDAIGFRESLIAKGTFGPECLSYNDVKIGEKFFIQHLEQARPGITAKVNGRKPQTYRNRIAVGDVIVPFIAFERPELRHLLANLRDTTVDGTKLKGSYNFKVPLDGVEISIGAGGIHGALDRQVIRSDAQRVVIDIDVTGYYPSVAIEYEFYPEHIGPVFSVVYRKIRDTRTGAKRIGDMVQAGILKLSNNGAFGMTGSEHSVLRDTRCLLAITVNGQLLQCLLAEAILRIPSARILQLNTDGLTVDIPRGYRELFDQICAWWMRHTCLELEFSEFDGLWLRDCNNYLARYSDIPFNKKNRGKVKRKGDYDWQMLSGSIGGQKAWNRDFSALVVPKAAEAAMLEDQDPADFIGHHSTPYDFLIKQRVKGGSRLEFGHSAEPLGKLVRYYIATSGQPLVKVMPPLPGKTAPRRIGIHAEGQAQALGTRKNWRCSMCNAQFTDKGSFEDHNKTAHAWPVKLAMQWDGRLDGLDPRWYVDQTEKLIF